MSHFNSRPSARGDTISRPADQHHQPFQFTPLREGRRAPNIAPNVLKYFNSRPSARGDHCGINTLLIPFISIHAPPRGATRMSSCARNPMNFNSRPSARGDTSAGFTRRLPYFNSRPSARGDEPAAATRGGTPISIHAPPRGATQKARKQHAKRHQFQFTPLREGRLAEVVDKILFHISIHAPPRGATEIEIINNCTFEFQFTPLREGRPARRRGTDQPPYFNSRPSARGDEIEIINNCTFEFQFTPLREGRRQKICNFCKSFVQPLQISMA